MCNTHALRGLKMRIFNGAGAASADRVNGRHRHVTLPILMDPTNTSGISVQGTRSANLEELLCV